ncbi:MAG: alpha-L-fucosidase [Bryobacteraceae bacterium]|nr:alpha-L-fucosidase [Bryobacterales bacterium]MEB2363297.1 alpha-L-fucosidase [Bryobacterales bacterium]NUN03654.1 alpha-L-fucosidase [Bryobacteraceae bacterium]
MNRRTFLVSPLACVPASALHAQPLAPFGAAPSPRQMRWHALEQYAFLHFTVNTFTDREWGYGDEDPDLFNPTSFDAGAIAGALSAGGMKGVILTCKHHDGFCLWPTKTTQHSVRSSKWRNGKGDVVGEISKAAREHKLQFGVYLSPWDRNTPLYGGPKYVEMYRAQLRELLTQYGPVFEVWHDGANGGDGFYGGAREKRTIDKRTYYDWPGTWDLIRKLQPDAVIFSDIGPDVRWVGNEKGVAAETCWATISPVGADGGPPAVGDVRQNDNQTGHRNGRQWLPAECDVSIRPGWFWHERENGKVKTPAQLFDLYLKSVGRNASFLLNVPPDRRGLLHDNDVKSLAAFGAMLRDTFARNLANGAKLQASSVRGAAYRPENLLDGIRGTYWAPREGIRNPEVIFELRRPETFDIVRVREAIQFGHRVDSFAVDIFRGNAWVRCAESTSIGACRLILLPEPVTAGRVRLRITKAAAPPALAGFGLYRTSQPG